MPMTDHNLESSTTSLDFYTIETSKIWYKLMPMTDHIQFDLVFVKENVLVHFYTIETSKIW